jgi:hypothetical protein
LLQHKRSKNWTNLAEKLRALVVMRRHWVRGASLQLSR